jgi:hypothetical protein
MLYDPTGKFENCPACTKIDQDDLRKPSVEEIFDEAWFIVIVLGFLHGAIGHFNKIANLGELLSGFSKLAKPFGPLLLLEISITILPNHQVMINISFFKLITLDFKSMFGIIVTELKLSMHLILPETALTGDLQHILD